MPPQPQLIIVAGPNGAGKSTYSRESFVSGFLWLDPDRYGLHPDAEDPIAAGRLVLGRVYTALLNREDFVLETTLSGKFPLKVLDAAKSAGYFITLLYVGLEDAEECIRRVRQRVAAGGHDVPENDIRRRFVRSINALPQAIDLADRVTIHDNGRDGPYRLIAQSDDFVTSTVATDVPVWAQDAVAALERRCKGARRS